MFDVHIQASKPKIARNESNDKTHAVNNKMHAVLHTYCHNDKGRMHPGVTKDRGEAGLG